VTVHLLADEGISYGLYFSEGNGAIELDLREQKKLFKIQWINIWERKNYL
jgi:hypothetical protein